VTIRNGVDTSKFAPNNNPAVREEFGITGRYAMFVGRITRQKGLAHLLRAWKNVPAEYGLVLAAGSPDEETVGNEVAALIAELQATRSNVWWIKEMLPHDKLTAALTQADLFLCPSIYEPLGIVVESQKLFHTKRQEFWLITPQITHVLKLTYLLQYLNCWQIRQG